MPDHYQLLHKPKKPEKKVNLRLSFLQQAQIVAAFQPSVSAGHTLVKLEAPYLLGSVINNPSRKTVLAFLEQEKVMPQLPANRIYIAEADYRRLEDRYTIPLPVKDIQTALKKFDGNEHSAEFINNSWAFGTNFTRVVKLLRDHGIGASYSAAGPKHSGPNAEENAEGRITLSPDEYRILQEKMGEILAAEARRMAKYKGQVQERLWQR